MRKFFNAYKNKIGYSIIIIIILPLIYNYITNLSSRQDLTDSSTLQTKISTQYSLDSGLQTNSANTNNSSGTQNNAGRDLNIYLPPVKDTTSRDKNAGHSQQQSPKIKVDGNDNIVGYAEPGGVVKQTIQKGPKHRHLTDKDLLEITTIPKQYKVKTLVRNDIENQLFADEIEEKLKELGYTVTGRIAWQVNVEGNSFGQGQISITVDDSLKEAEVAVLPTKSQQR